MIEQNIKNQIKQVMRPIHDIVSTLEQEGIESSFKVNSYTFELLTELRYAIGMTLYNKELFIDNTLKNNVIKTRLH